MHNKQLVLMGLGAVAVAALLYVNNRRVVMQRRAVQIVKPSPTSINFYLDPLNLIGLELPEGAGYSPSGGYFGARGSCKCQ